MMKYFKSYYIYMIIYGLFLLFDVILRLTLEASEVTVMYVPLLVVGTVMVLATIVLSIIALVKFSKLKKKLIRIVPTYFLAMIVASFSIGLIGGLLGKTIDQVGGLMIYIDMLSVVVILGMSVYILKKF
ncbi:hypothetical protein ACFL96_09275 [Thermoproteota archaeon]